MCILSGNLAEIYCDALSAMVFDIFLGLLSGTNSDILFDIYIYIYHIFLQSIQPFHQAFYLTFFWHSIRHSYIWRTYIYTHTHLYKYMIYIYISWHPIWPIWRSLGHLTWRSTVLGISLWHMAFYLAFFLTSYLASLLNFYLRQLPVYLAFYAA